MCPARVLWGAANKIDDQTRVILNTSGTLDLAGHSDTIGSLSGEGAVLPNSGRLTVSSRGGQAAFAGSLRGTGTFRVEGFDRGFELSGHSSFTGLVQVASQRMTNFPQMIAETPCHLILSGSASNAVVALSGESVLSGNGVAQNLTTVNATVRPGPGTLRFLESCTLDAESQLEISLDGPEAGRLQTGQLNLANAALNVTYQGTDPGSLFTLIAARATAGSTFGGIGEGAWLVAGDPAAPSEFRITYVGNNGSNVVLERTGLFAPPLLRIRQLTLGTRVVEWPIAAQGYTLQYSPTPTAATWTSDGLPVPNVTATVFFVNDRRSGEQHFYRLIR